MFCASWPKIAPLNFSGSADMALAHEFGHTALNQRRRFGQTRRIRRRSGQMRAAKRCARFIA